MTPRARLRGAWQHALTGRASRFGLRGENPLGPETCLGEPMDERLESTARRVAEILVDELKLEDVTPETFDMDIDLVDELGIDSMDLTTVVLVLQDEWGVSIYEEDYPRLGTVRKIAEYLLEKTDAAAAETA